MNPVRLHLDHALALCETDLAKSSIRTDLRQFILDETSGQPAAHPLCYYAATVGSVA